MNLGLRIKDFFSLVFPPLCESCKQLLVGDERHLCTCCDFHLPRTGFCHWPENALTRVFWGRVGIEGGAALYYYQKGGGVQELVHKLKYRGGQDLGRYLGRLLGRELLESPHFREIDCIIPVPLHARRLRQRGFNQSEAFGAGISEILGCPLNTEALIRRSATQTQTRKSRFRRWENVSGVFEFREDGLSGARNLLLVDDVLTTGSTLEACSQQLLSGKNTRVWVATIGFTA